MTSLQVKVMRNLFTEYKTPTMSECEMLGKDIGLQKRVIQVWFQNARAKEKKSKLQYSKAFGGSSDLDFTRPPEDCTLCNFKYSHKYTIQDHIFTKRHIDNVKKFIHSQMDSERDYIDPTTLSQLVRQREIERASQQKPWPASSAVPGEPSMAEHPHLAQLHAMGLQAMGLPAQGKIQYSKTCKLILAVILLKMQTIMLHKNV